MERATTDKTILPGLAALVGPKLLHLRDLVRADGGDLRLVGGAIRDHVRGEVPNDLDVAFDDPERRMAEHLVSAGMEFERPYPGDWLFLASDAGMKIDLISVRRFWSMPGDDVWREDLGVRDFTMNAMGATFEGELSDPHGGMADAIAGRVRWNGWAPERMEEDPIRIVRWARFRSLFGEPLDADELFHMLPPDGPDTPEYFAWRLKGASTERLVREIGRIHDLPDPEPTLAFLDSIEVSSAIGLETLRIPRSDLGAAIDAARNDGNEAPSP